MSYKGFVGSVAYHPEDALFHGKLLGVTDLVLFEGSSVTTLQESFEQAVDDYINLCAETNTPPLKSYKGSFNIRISPELHQTIAQQAHLSGKSLNQWVQEALTHHLHQS